MQRTWLLVLALLACPATSEEGDLGPLTVYDVVGSASLDRGGAVSPLVAGNSIQPGDDLIVTDNGLVALEDKDDDISMGRGRVKITGGKTTKSRRSRGRWYIVRKSRSPKWIRRFKPYWGKVWIENGFIWDHELGFVSYGHSVGVTTDGGKEGILEQEELDFELYVTDWDKARFAEVGVDNEDARIALADMVREVVLEGDRRLRDHIAENPGNIEAELDAFLKSSAVTYTAILDDAVEAAVDPIVLRGKIQTWIQKPLVGKLVSVRRIAGKSWLVKKRLCRHKKKRGKIRRRKPRRLRPRKNYGRRRWWPKKKKRDRRWQRRYTYGYWKKVRKLSDAQITQRIQHDFPDWHTEVQRSGLGTWKR